MLKKKAMAVIMSAMMLSSALFMTGCGNKDVEPNANAGNTTTEGGNSQTGGSTASGDLFINDEWSYGQVAYGGGGFVTGVFSTSEENLYYARTDVGGAYRYDGATSRWISISSDVTQEDVGLLGIDGLCFEEENPAHVVLLAGTSYFSGGKTAILISNDYGVTYDTVEVTDLIKVHGNGMGRQNGERIAFNPDNNKELWAGGRTGGLIKSTDGGYTWESVSSFPVTETDNNNGINGILITKAANSSDGVQKIFVSVSRKDAENIYVSADGGSSWDPVGALPQKYMPQRMKLDANNNILVTYGGSEGPWNGSGGAIYRYDIAADSAEDISPANLNFGDIVSDPEDANKLVASTENVWMVQANGSYGDQFYKSTDGGKNWTCINDTMTMDNGGVEWVTSYAIHWCGSIMIDPFNTDRIAVVSGNGIFKSDNIWDKAPNFSFFSDGIEETVPLDIVSIVDGPLFVAIGDYDGFVTEDVTVNGTYQDSTRGTTTGIAVAAEDTDIRVKVGNNDKQQSLYYTIDGGNKWNKISNKPASGTVLRGGSVAITADGKRILWSPENELASYYTDDFGENWTQITGITSNYYLYADPTDSNCVYACANETLSISTDGGASFTAAKISYNVQKKFSVSPTGDVYIACAMKGVAVSKDQGVTFEPLNVLYATAVGLGAGKTANDPYVIYIYGRPATGDTLGIYMSEDGGDTWSRVNDDLHNYGGPGNGNFVIGDYNVYGRCYMATVGMGLAYFDKNDK